jgi:recombination protein RecR
MLTPLLERMIRDISCLPGVGSKTARRMIFDLLTQDRNKGLKLAETLKQGLCDIKTCARCQYFTEANECSICLSPKRQNNRICVVETAADLMAIEQSHAYQGLYFVLMGKISPLDGIGANDLNFKLLFSRIESESIQEVILATNPTIEGEATAQYIMDALSQKSAITCSRIAQGVPLGGELEYIDSGTLMRSFNDRNKLQYPQRKTLPVPDESGVE